MKYLLFAIIFLLSIVAASLFVVSVTPPQKAQQNPSHASPLPRLRCPAPKEYCTQGKILKVKDQFAGIGYSVPADTPLYAVFSGGLRPGWVVSSNGRKPLIILENKDKQIEAVYQITGPDYTRYEAVAQGGKIGEAREGSIDQTGANLIITIRRMNAKTNPLIPLEASDFIPL